MFRASKFSIAQVESYKKKKVDKKKKVESYKKKKVTVKFDRECLQKSDLIIAYQLVYIHHSLIIY